MWCAYQCTRSILKMLRPETRQRTTTTHVVLERVGIVLPGAAALVAFHDFVLAACARIQVVCSPLSSHREVSMRSISQFSTEKKTPSAAVDKAPGLRFDKLLGCFLLFSVAVDEPGSTAPYPVAVTPIKAE